MKSTFGSVQNLADALQKQAVDAGAKAPSVRGADWRLATVQTVNASGTVVTTDGITVRRLETYTLPLVGDVIAITQSSAGNWLAFGRLSSGDPGWTTPTLGTGYTQGNSSSQGNNNGPIRYRRINVQGTWFMEWDGAATRTSGAQTSNILNAALATQFRPVNRASMVIARNAADITGTANSTSVYHSCKVDFQQDGTVSLVSATVGSAEATWISLKGCRYPLD
ncbi:hypothetical protein [Streptomyces luteocolor]|uniref:hypothetical protein n=1 Tax=Streptomyces luteocolor TaxID=285500 RepID=UPI0008529B82|nr:hypothetical protein [Streptomyces luteocolor]